MAEEPNLWDLMRDELGWNRHEAKVGFYSGAMGSKDPLHLQAYSDGLELMKKHPAIMGNLLRRDE